jgi:hypothetical protein
VDETVESAKEKTKKISINSKIFYNEKNNFFNDSDDVQRNHGVWTK